MVKTAAQALANWQRGTQGKQQNYVDGINSGKPWQAATLAGEGAMVTNFNAAMNEGRFRTAVQAVTDAQWKAAAVAKASNWSSGVQMAGPKYQQSYTTKLLPMVEAGLAAIQGSPRGSLAQNLERARLFATAVADAKTRMG